MREDLRIAFFPDSYTEVNGVALTSNKLTDFARRKGYPFLCIHADKKTEILKNGEYTEFCLKRSRLSFSLDEDLSYDPFFNRHLSRIGKEIESFNPDVIHITGLNDVSIIGAYLAWKRQIPLLASWHTNIHEFAARRLDKMFRFLPGSTRNSLTGFAERKILAGSVLYYKMAKMVLSPNQELVDMLGTGTGRQSRLMQRGVDTNFLTPEKRTTDDGKIRLGFVGRLRAEKDVRLLAQVEKTLLDAGRSNFEFLIVGEGTEREWLSQNMKTAKFTGFLSGEDLAEAYANMDIFVFPSATDAFGNVVQEANASGVPAIVSDRGGPKFIIRHGVTGFIAESPEEFSRYSLELLDDQEKLSKMKKAAREFAHERSWDSVFEKVYAAYGETLIIAEERKRAAAAAKTARV
ncbi:MAG TPA: glycosyltransferase [Pyrinomonadaceae bacterium]|nr:glycosyltransferase [Pyrinomonadaceae bacterium]